MDILSIKNSIQNKKLLENIDWIHSWNEIRKIDVFGQSLNHLMSLKDIYYINSHLKIKGNIVRKFVELTIKTSENLILEIKERSNLILVLGYESGNQYIPQFYFPNCYIAKTRLINIPPAGEITFLLDDHYNLEKPVEEPTLYCHLLRIMEES